MFRNNETKYATIKEMREREKKEKETALREACENLAQERYGKEKMANWSNQHKGLWFLPIVDDDGNVVKLALMKPIDRSILSFATTKIADEGLYSFLEACMRECWVEGDAEILEEDEYFIPAANKFNAIVEGRKAAFLKR